MRSLMAAPAISLILLAGCSQPQHLFTEPANVAVAPASSSVPSAPRGYTSHPAHGGPGQVFKLAIDRDFDDRQRAKILSAMEEWNYVLNGAARFELVPNPVPGGWTVAVSRRGILPIDYTNPQPLAVNVRTGKLGGVIVVYVSRIEDPYLSNDGTRDLRGVMVHELGVALGGGNGSTLKTASIQSCIDKDMATSVGTVLEIPVERLNWCERGSTVAAR
jgi:hypothetical protein